jgi:hypothetical protein
VGFVMGVLATGSGIHCDTAGIEEVQRTVVYAWRLLVHGHRLLHSCATDWKPYPTNIWFYEE